MFVLVFDQGPESGKASFEQGKYSNDFVRLDKCVPPCRLLRRCERRLRRFGWRVDAAMRKERPLSSK
jgi:hypothetical protein